MGRAAASSPHGFTQSPGKDIMKKHRVFPQKKGAAMHGSALAQSHLGRVKSQRRKAGEQTSAPAIAPLLNQWRQY